MEYKKTIIDRYKHMRSLHSLQKTYEGWYAFVGIGNHSVNNLYPVLDYLHVPLKYICCRSLDKLPFIEAAYPGVKATTSLRDILDDDEVKGVFVSASPDSHFPIASEVIRSGKALFIEKPPCRNSEELRRLVDLRKAAGMPPVVAGLQKRAAPSMRILKRELKKCSGVLTYNMKYLTGAYPEGDALLDLFIHPLDSVSFLFGKAEVKHCERVEDHTMMLTLRHEDAVGVMELSTGYTWSDATESLTINTNKGIFNLNQMDSLEFRRKQSSFMGMPMEKILPRGKTTVELFGRNNFVPIRQNNQIESQGYFDTIRNFLDDVEKGVSSETQSLESLTGTYSLLDQIRSSTERK